MSTFENPNIVLIGMPGSGKSTIGIILAKFLSKEFLDTDILIQTRTGKSLQEIIDHEGHMVLRHIEEEVILSVICTNHIIATGGSVPYSDLSMKHLKKNGIIVFLDVNLATLRKRIHSFETRGLAKRPDQSLTDLFNERFSLYTQYADITIDGNMLTHEETCMEIEQKLLKAPYNVPRKFKHIHSFGRKAS